MARLGLAISGGFITHRVVECVQLAEDLGYESAWVAQGAWRRSICYPGCLCSGHQPHSVGASISSVFVRSAPTIAMAAATVDHLSNQRFILGLGSSHRVQVGPEHGIPYSKPIQRVRDSIRVSLAHPAAGWRGLLPRGNHHDRAL